jgi:hypothetical protein
MGVYAISSRPAAPGNKSLFAGFFSEKEESSFFEKKEAKKLLCLVARATANRVEQG